MKWNMKNTVTAILLGAALACGGPTALLPQDMSPFSVSAAGMYEDHLWGNSNYELVRGHMGYGFYIDWSSYVLISERGIGPGQTRFAVNVIRYNVEQGTVDGSNTYEYIESRQGTYCSIDGGDFRAFDQNKEFGYNQIVIETYKRCMQNLYN